MKDLPAELGTVEDLQVGDTSSPFILHIQDIHANPEVQKTIRDILKWVSDKHLEIASSPSGLLAKTKFLSLRAPEGSAAISKLVIGLEGAAGTIHPEYLDFFQNEPEKNTEIVQDLLKKGELTGAELFAWEQRQNPKEAQPLFFGLEDPLLYRESFDAYRKVLFAQDTIHEALEKIEKDLELAKSRIFSPVLNEFFREKSRRKQGDYGSGDSVQAVQLLPYIEYLARQAQEALQIDVSDPVEQLRLPQMARILALQRLEKEAAPQKAEEQKQKLEVILGGTKDPAAGDPKKVSPRRAMEGLFLSAFRNKINLSGYPDYLKTTGREILQAEINASALSSEMEKIENALLYRWAAGPEQKQLVRRILDFELLQKLLTLHLTRDEFESVIAGPPKRDETISATLDRLRRFPLEIASDATHPRNDMIYFDSAVTFYRNAQKRDEVLLDRLLRKAEGSRFAVLVTGGFHTHGLSAAMKERGLGYAVIRPRVKSLEDDNLLAKVFRDENAVLPPEFRKFALTKQEALFLKKILETQNPQSTADAVNAHPVLSKKLSVRVGGELSPQALSVSGPAVSEQGPVPALKPHAMVDELIMAEGYEQSRGLLAGAAPALDAPAGLEVLFAGLRFMERSEARASLREENDFLQTGMRELERYIDEVKPASILEKFTLEKHLSFAKKPDILLSYFRMVETQNMAHLLLDDYKKARSASNLDEALLIEDMVDAYLFSAPKISNRYRSALWLKKEILFDMLEIQGRAGDLRDQYASLAALSGSVGKTKARELLDLLTELKTKPGAHLPASLAYVLQEIVRLDAIYQERKIPVPANSDLSGHVAIIGLGGDSTLATAALLAKKQYKVFALDEPKARIEIEDQLQKPEFEPHVQQLAKEAEASGNLEFFNLSDEAFEAAIRHSGIIYLDASDSSGLGPKEYIAHLTAMAKRAGRILAKLRVQENDTHFRLFAFRGTFPVGTMRELYNQLRKESNDDSNFEVAYHLDFARRGSAIADEENRQVVIGLSGAPAGGIDFRKQNIQNEKSLQALKLLGPLVQSLIGEQAMGEKLQINSLEGAELAKQTLLINMAAKHNLMNEFAPLVVKNRGSLQDVGLIAGMDHRIGRAFTRPNMALGGRLIQQIRFLYDSYVLELKKQRDDGKFYSPAMIPDPNNLSAITEELREVLKKPHLQDIRLKDSKYQMALFLAGILAGNSASLTFFENQTIGALKKISPSRPLRDMQVAILGVAYKEGTDQITESASVRYFEWLVEKQGIKRFRIYDALALGNFQNWLEKKKREFPQYESVDVIYEDQDPRKIMKGNDLVLIGTPHKKISDTPPADLKNELGNALLVDGVTLYSVPGTDRSLYTVRDIEKAGINYLAFGSPALGPAFQISGFHHKGELIPKDKEAGSGKTRPMKVAFFGGGYVGFVSGTILAFAGHFVTIIDVVQANIDRWRKGETTIKEEKLDELLKKSLEAGKLQFVLNSKKIAQTKEDAEVTEEARQAILDNDILYMAVNTPEGDDGQADLKYIRTVTHQIGMVLKEMTPEERRDPEKVKVIAIKSTVPGSVFAEVARILEKDYGLKEGIDFWLASNPEILVEGEAVKGAQNPSRTIFGIRSPQNAEADAREGEAKVRQRLIDLWDPIRKEHAHPMIVTDEMSSTTGKYLSNALLALSVSLTNVSAALARENGVDFRREIETVLRKDPRMSPSAHCSPGPGYGGHCFPKDAEEVIASTLAAFGSTGHKVHLMELTDMANEATKRRVPYETTKALLDGDGSAAEGRQSLASQTIGVVGLTFKDGTDDVRDSPAVVSAIEFVLKGAKVRLYDANFKSEDLKNRIKARFAEEFARIFMLDYVSSKGKFKTEANIMDYYFGGIDPKIRFDDTLKGETDGKPDTILDSTNAVVLLGARKEYHPILIGELQRLKRVNESRLLVPLFDARGVFSEEEILAAGIHSPGVGRPDFGGDKERKIRSEIRKLELSTDGLITALSGLGLAVNPDLPSRVRSAIHDAARTGGLPGIYSIQDVSAWYEEELGMSAFRAAEYAIPFAAREILPVPASLPDLNENEKKALTPEIMAQYFTPLDDAGSSKKRYVVAENLDRLPPFDANMKLWIRHLAVHPDLVWNAAVNGISKEEARKFLSDLLEEAREWGYVLRPEQIVIQNSSHRGFDSKTIGTPLRNGWAWAYLADDKTVLDAVPIRPDTELLLLESAKLSERTAARLLSSDFIRQGNRGDRSRIQTPAELGRARYENLLNAVRNFAVIASSA